MYHKSEKPIFSARLQPQYEGLGHSAHVTGGVWLQLMKEGLPRLPHLLTNDLQSHRKPQLPAEKRKQGGCRLHLGCGQGEFRFSIQASSKILFCMCEHIIHYKHIYI